MNTQVRWSGTPMILLVAALAGCQGSQTLPPPAPAAVPAEATAPGSGVEADIARLKDERARAALAAQQPDDKSEANYHAYLDKCRKDYAASDARIAASGRKDSEYLPVAGFPYLRTERLMSSYRNEVAGNLDKTGTLLLQMREYDSIARDIEFTNMGIGKGARADELNSLRTCAVWLSEADAGDAATFARMVAAMRVPDAAVPEPVPEAARRAADARRAKVAGRFAAVLPPLRKATLWSLGTEAVDATVPLNLAAAQKDELGRVGLVMSQWPALAESVAPKLLVERDADQPGTPVLTANGVGIDTQHPAIYYLPSYARVGDRMLIQMIYFVWFAGADGQGLDGLIWRVTVDEQGQPLMRESIRANGFDHLWFPQAGLALRETDPGLAPQLPQAVPEGSFAVRLAAATHDVRRLVPVSTLNGVRTARLVLRPYEDLMTLKRPGGGTRSLFGADGLVPGTRQKGYEAFVMAGIPEAGALRRWGDHRSAPLAARYLDDPHLLDASFALGPAPTQRAQSAPAVAGGGD